MTLIPPTRYTISIEDFSCSNDEPNSKGRFGERKEKRKSMLRNDKITSFKLVRRPKKRNRSCEEEDFLPLSKKINNLHINNWGNIDSPQEQLIKWNNSSDQFLPLCSHNVAENGRQENDSRNSSPFKNAQENLQNGYSETEINGHYKHLNNESFKNENYSQGKYTNGESSSHCDRVQSNWSIVYNPDLSVEENPYYYESNKLLFDLYVERLQRGGY